MTTVISGLCFCKKSFEIICCIKNVERLAASGRLFLDSM